MIKEPKIEKETCHKTDEKGTAVAAAAATTTTKAVEVAVKK